MDEVAETTDPFACRGPFTVPESVRVPPSVNDPSAANVDDAVAPNFAVSAEKIVEDACWMFVTYVVVVGDKKLPLTSQLFPKVMAAVA